MASEYARPFSLPVVSLPEAVDLFLRSAPWVPLTASLAPKTAFSFPLSSFSDPPKDAAAGV